MSVNSQEEKKTVEEAEKIGAAKRMMKEALQGLGVGGGGGGGGGGLLDTLQSVASS